jgi:hypothetical protein
VATKSNDQVSGTINGIERELRSEDPAFVRRVHAIRRAEVANAFTVVALLASGAVLLAVGLATFSWAVWCAGVVALLASIAVDERHKRVLRRSPRRRHDRPSRRWRKRFDWSGPLLAGVARRVPGPGWAWPALPRRDGRLGWDERVVLASTLPEVTTHLRGPDDLARWFPGVRRVHHDEGTDILVGDPGRMRLRVIAERWVPGAGGTLEAAADGAIITGHVTMRMVLVPAEHTGTVRSGVEVWVHAESDNSRQAHRLLPRLRSVTKAGLRHMEAELSVA